MDVVKVKEAGVHTALRVIHRKAVQEYGANAKGASMRIGPERDQLAIHLADGQSSTVADAILSAIALPTCVSSGLVITTNVGTYVVGDEITVTADATDTKYVLVTILIDDTSGDPEIYAYEKTTGQYGQVPAGKTQCTRLKEYSIPALGTVLTEDINYIL